MYLFFDTETTGLPRRYKAPIEQLDNWPRIVQIAWLLYSEQQTCIAQKDYIIKPQGFTIPQRAAEIHGITTQKAIDEGQNLKEVLQEFNQDLFSVDYVIAHNLDFDEKIVSAEFLRMNIDHPLESIEKICTMKTATKFCKIPHTYGGYKWPNLQELYTTLFNKRFDGMHNAFSDVTACAKCYFELKKRKIC